MNESQIIEVAMKAALLTIMFTMGLQLCLNDFQRVLRMWGTISLGILGQSVLLPIFAVIVIKVFSLDTYMAIGLFLIAICPGGPLSNYFAHIGGGCVALSVSLTAATTLLSLITLPIAAGLAFQFGIGFQLDNLPRLFIIKSMFVGLVIPIGIGLVVNNIAPKLSAALVTYLSKLGMLLVLGVLLLIAYQYKDIYAGMEAPMLVSVLLLNLLGMVTGYWLPRMINGPATHSKTFAFEIGIQNVPLAMVLAYGLVGMGGQSTALIVGVIGMYAIISVITAWAAVLIFRRKSAPFQTSNNFGRSSVE